MISTNPNSYNGLYPWLMNKGLSKAGFIAIETPDRSHISYQELHERVCKMQDKLQQQGLKKGARILCIAPKSIALIQMYLCCLRAGFVMVPISQSSPIEEVKFIIADTEPQLIVADPTLDIPTNIRRMGADEDGHGSLTDDIDRFSADIDEANIQEDDIATMFYSSNADVKPVGIPLTHRNIMSNNSVLHRIWRFDRHQRDVLLHVLPLYYMPGLIIAPNLTFLNGGRIIFCSHFDAAQCVTLMPKATVLMGVPTIFHRINQFPNLTPSAARSMRMFISGSAYLSKEVFGTFKRLTGHSILNRYGTTETGIITSNPNSSPGAIDTVGFVLPGFKTRIVDEAGSDATETGRPGILQVSGQSVFPGYWKRPDLNERSLTEDGFFITSDLASADKENRICLIGSVQDALTSGGRSIHPIEIEMRLNSVEEIESSAIIGVPHEDMGAIPVAYIKLVGNRNLDDTLKQKIEELLQNSIAGFKRPRDIVPIEKWPLNKVGKLDRSRLISLYQEQSSVTR